MAGSFATFGKHETNDIRLPSGRSTAFTNHHFLFSLAPHSGELIVRDLSPRRLIIEVQNASAEETALYGLHGNNPRQRVIPRIKRPIFLTIGHNATFQLYWFPEVLLGDDIVVQQELLNVARRIAVGGMTMSSADPSQSDITVTSNRNYELRSMNTPLNLGVGTVRKYHTYRRLGSGAFGTVSKVVDLSSGELLAVKELKKGQKNDSWKASFKTEVETIARIKHVRLLHSPADQSDLTMQSLTLPNLCPIRDSASAATSISFSASIMAAWKGSCRSIIASVA